MPNQDLQALAAQAVDIARRSGAQDAVASVVHRRDVKTTVRNGEIEKTEDSTSQGLSIALYADGRFSTHNTSDFRPASLKTFIQDAIFLTQAVERDNHRRILPKEFFAGIKPVDLNLVDARIQTRDVEQRLADAFAMDKVGKGRSGLISMTSSSGDTQYSEVTVGSNGFQGKSERTHAALRASVTIQGKNGRKPADGLSKVAVNLDMLGAPDVFAEEAIRRTFAVQDIKKGPTVKTHMIVEALAGGRLLNYLINPAMGAAVQQKRSYLVNGLNKPFASKLLTVTDEPLMPKGLRSRLWDDDGIAARTLPIIEDGILRNYYLSDYYARKLDMQPTASSASNVIVKPGNRSAATIMGDVKDAILVTEWNGGNMDATTGDFSVGASGFRIRNGKIGEAINEMNVTGNMVELLNNLVEVGNDPWQFSSIQTPTLVFEGVQFSGA